MKTITFLTALLIALALGITPLSNTKAQVPVLTITSYADTISGAETHTYDYSRAIIDPSYMSVQIIFDHISGSSDSCKCKLQSSLDKTNFFDLSGYAQGISDKFGTSDANHIFYYNTYPYVAPYLRVSCQHWATGTARFKILLYLMRKLD